MAKKKHIIFFILRIAIALFLALLVLLSVTQTEVSTDIYKQLSVILSGDESMLALLRLASGFCMLVIAVLLLVKRPSVISVGAILATGFMVIMLVFYALIMSIEFAESPLMLVATCSALVASLVVLFRFRGSFPVLGKFT